MCNGPSVSYYMPAEYTRHLSCLLIYPHNRTVWRETNCLPARLAFRNVARAISACQENVTVFCLDEKTAQELKQDLHREKHLEEEDSKRGKIEVRVVESDDSWCRDTGPTFLVRRCGRENKYTKEDSSPPLAAVDWEFNAYGGPVDGCYWPCDKDRALAQKMYQILAKDFHPMKLAYLPRKDLILEGGSIHVDGEGTVLTTEECLLHKNRNCDLTKEEIEERVLEQLGATKMVWLKRGLYMDEDTNGHIDNIACFAKPGHIILSWCDEPSDPQYAISHEALATLENSTDAKGRSFEITKLHIPYPPLKYTQEEVDGLLETAEEPSLQENAPTKDAAAATNAKANGSGDAVSGNSCEGRRAGERLAASYVNFYIANGGIVVPGFDRPETDAAAVKTLSEVFGDRGGKVVQVPSREIVLGGGNIHCITQQVPDPYAE